MADVEDDAVYMTLAEFEGLLEYSCSLPTGTTAGKRWRRRVPYMHRPGDRPQWFMGEYGEPEGDQVPITWREIFIHG